MCVAPPLCLQGLIRRYSVTRILSPPGQTKVLLIVANVLEIQRQQSMCVSLVMVDDVTTAHMILGATSERRIPTPSTHGPCNGAGAFVSLTLLDSHWIRINGNRAIVSLPSDCGYPHGYCVVDQPPKMGPMDDLCDLMW